MFSHALMAHSLGDSIRSTVVVLKNLFFFLQSQCRWNSLNIFFPSEKETLLEWWEGKHESGENSVGRQRKRIQIQFFTECYVIFFSLFSTILSSLSLYFSVRIDNTVRFSHSSFFGWWKTEFSMLSTLLCSYNFISEYSSYSQQLLFRLIPMYCRIFFLYSHSIWSVLSMSNTNLFCSKIVPNSFEN